MFSAVLNAQNKTTSYTPINSVIWIPATNSNSEYTGSEQTVIVDTVDPINATYIVNTVGATNAGEVAQSTLQGTNSYSGTFTSPTLTIVPTPLTGTSQNDGGYYNGQPISGVVAININGTYTGDATITETNVGTYGPNILTGTGNYSGTLTTGTFTISPGYFSVSIEVAQTDPSSFTYSIQAKVVGAPTSAIITTYISGTQVETFTINDTTYTEGTGLLYVNGNAYTYTATAGGYNDYGNSFNFF